MRRLGLMCLLMCAVFSGFSLGQTDDFEKSVLADEAKMTKSWNAHDTASVDALVDDGFRGITSRGRVIVKKDLLQSVKLNSEGSTDISEQHVAIYGDTAVYTALVADHFKPAKGAPAVIRTRVTDIWVRRQGKNVLVASQETRVP